MRHFYVIVVQWRQRNVQKSVMHVQSCCFAYCFFDVLVLVAVVKSIGSLSSDVFERRTSTGSEVFSLLTCLDDIKFLFLSFFTVIEAIWLKICAKPPSKFEKRPLPVDVRRSKTLLLKLPFKFLMRRYTSNNLLSENQLTEQNSALD